jgi:CRP-like cAMP-binding protein
VQKRLGKGDYLFRQGAPFEGFYVVHQGAINFPSHQCVRQTQVIHVFRGGESFAEAALVLSSLHLLHAGSHIDQARSGWSLESRLLARLAQDGHQSLRCARLNQWHLAKLVNGESRSHRNCRNIDNNRGVIPYGQATY